MWTRSFSMQGILVVGTTPQCGKTVVAAGLAAALQTEGFGTQAAKILACGPHDATSSRQDTPFLMRVTRSAQVYSSLQLESAEEMTSLHWQRLLEYSRQFVYPVLLESPGSVAQPLMLLDHGWKDATDWAAALNIPLLVVTPKNNQLIGQLAPTLCYLKEKGASVVGWIGVETLPTDTPHWEVDVLLLGQTTGIHCLGTLGYSPSICVEKQQQGNLIKLTQYGIDLLPIQRAMELVMIQGAS